MENAGIDTQCSQDISPEDDDDNCPICQCPIDDHSDVQLEECSTTELVQSEQDIEDACSQYTRSSDAMGTSSLSAGKCLSKKSQTPHQDPGESALLEKEANALEEKRKLNRDKKHIIAQRSNHDEDSNGSKSQISTVAAQLSFSARDRGVNLDIYVAR